MKKAIIYFIALMVGYTSLVYAAKEEIKPLPVGSEVLSFTIKTVNGDIINKRAISIDDYFESGDSPAKAIIISFFATYCKPCKKELPFLQALYENYHDDGLAVMVISIDREQEKVDELKALVDEHKLTYPVLWDRFNIVAKRYHISQLPSLYMINPDKKITMVNVGYNEGISHKLYTETLKSLGLPTDSEIPETLKAHIKETAVAQEAEPAKEETQAAQEETTTEEVSLNPKQKALVDFFEQQVSTLNTKCSKVKSCIRALARLSKAPTNKTKRTYRQLKKKGQLVEALTTKLQSLKEKRDQLIAENNVISKNKKIKRFVKKFDKAVGL